MRFTIPELLNAPPTMAEGEKLLQQFAEAVHQPADPFDGQGDFEYGTQAFERMQSRVAELGAQVAAADGALRNVAAILDRPLSKLSKKDLIVLIQAAQDAVADAKEQMG